MSTKITTIYDQLITVLGTTFPNHYKITDPYTVENNDFKLLNKGYGFFINGGQNTNRMIACELSISRSITFINTLVQRGTDRDLTIRQAAEKTILEDQYLLIKAVEMDSTLLQSCCKMVYIGDSGIKFLNDEHRNFLTIETQFSFEYFERLT
jgi:hypothetical protein